MVAVRRLVAHAEQFKRSRLRRGSERKEAQVRLPPTRRGLPGEEVFPVTTRLLVGKVSRLSRRERRIPVRTLAEGELQVLCRLPGLRGVRLVHDHRVATLGELGDLVEDEGELLERGDDHPRLLPGERLCKLSGILVDLLDDPMHVLELVDRVLQLTIEHHPIGDHYDLVEDLLLANVVEGGKPMCEPGDRVRLA